MHFYSYDVESLWNIFTCVIRCPDGSERIFEVSDRVDQSVQFLTFLRGLMRFRDVVWMVGYNNNGYDWPLLQFLLGHQSFTAADAKLKSNQLINTDWNNRFKNVIWPRDQLIRQLDLMKVHGFDNVARSTSLKQLEIALQLPTVVEFQVDWDAPLPHERFDGLVAYNRWDVHATETFLHKSKPNIDLRVKIGNDTGLDLMNLSDVDMGEKIVIEELEKLQAGITGTKTRGPKRTTVRDQIALGPLVFDQIRFETPQFQAIHQHFLKTTIRETKGVFEGLTADFAGMEWTFGTGGIHAAPEDGRACIATPERAVITVDVSSYYPNVAVENRLAPEHLGQAFVSVYATLRDRKAAYKAQGLKQEETTAKLSANAVFGKGGSKFSCLSDPAFMLGITINGQLLLCVLAEQLAKVPTLVMVQANTDGITLCVDRVYMPQVDAIVKWWEQSTSLTLDYDKWSKFFQRDVNNYLAVDEDGKCKGKGAFEWRIGLDGRDSWHKNQSHKIITIAAEELLVNGTPIAETVYACDDAFKFMHTLKAARKDVVLLGGQLVEYVDELSLDSKGNHPKRNRHTGGETQQRIGRFYIAHRGQQLWKIMPPMAKLAHHPRPQAIEKGRLSAMCNDLYDFDWNNLNREYYIEKAQELVDSTGYK